MEVMALTHFVAPPPPPFTAVHRQAFQVVGAEML